jgi:hypothetical protein
MKNPSLPPRTQRAQRKTSSKLGVLGGLCGENRAFSADS